MSGIIVKSGKRLSGKVKISGSKNAVLPIMAASILTDEKNIITNVPNLSDVRIMRNLLKRIGCDVNFSKDRLAIKSNNAFEKEIPYEPVGKMRASFLLSGAMLAKNGYIKISLPGGCPIGARPIDLHLKGFTAMGADVRQGHGYIEISADKLSGTKIYLDFPSVGATENLMTAACLAEGETVIENAAAEPEIVDLANFLRKMGAVISGDGSNTVKICGTHCLCGAKHNVIPDRIEAGTFMAAIAVTNGHACVENISPEHMKPITAKLEEMGVRLTPHNDCIDVDAEHALHSVNIKTLPFPGFPTDMQAQFAALMCTTEGTGVVVETIFENRFLYVSELNRMGANIKIDGRTAVVDGGRQLTGAAVSAMDLRGGAALVLAGLAAVGTTKISNAELIERGYENLTEKLRAMGADIEKTK